MTHRGLGAVVHGRLETTCGLCEEHATFGGGSTLARVEAARAGGWRQSDRYGWVCPDHQGLLKYERKYLQSVPNFQGDPGE